MLRESQAWSSAAFPDIVIFTRGPVPALEAERVAGAVGRLLARHTVTGGARVRVTAAAGESETLLVQVNLARSDRPVRMQVRTRGPNEVLSVVVRLERQLTGATVRDWPDPARPALANPGAGKIVRRKVFALDTLRPKSAAAVMDALDFDVHLFVDAETGEDSVVYRAGPSGLRLARRSRMHPPSDTGGRIFTVHSRPTPVLPESAAVERLCEHGLPFVFYLDAFTGRGHLLYRRYDADLTLVTPGAEAEFDTER
ncbi:sigma 54 modulation/S30EA ribosomal C-terminal domain-containing protein [Nocardia cerradoensis]|uniref:Sigma 54 modulation/S30EA ribosomal protein C-terminal domain-containing protein n=1 Tax=Nocardia cerradoensis TaxID=85688 RepID=A0A231GZE7_9NOCA|nr:sigma 54 modulation/S30EA ribosomal C-terminal domain-containing protein [Nocardia cerradoensis]OXR41945.1 hypothetical protein B7C42_05929 [Nocardia cerradoensis]